MTDEVKSFTNLWLWWQFIKSTASNIRKSKVNYCLGFTACFLVVFVVAILVTLLSKSPLIFLRLSELSHSEMDSIVVAGDWTGYEFINYTLLSTEVLSSKYQHHSPRRTNGAQLYFSSECSDKNSSDLKWMYFPLQEQDYCGFARNLARCFNKHCPASAHSVDVISIKSDQETKILLGREWKLPPLKQGEIYLHSAVAARQKTSPVGQVVYLEFSTRELFSNTLWYELTGTRAELNPVIYVPFKVAGLYPNPVGKHPVATTNIGLIEYDLLMKHVANYMDPGAFSPEAIKNVSNLNLDHYAQLVVINLPPPRISLYLNSNYDQIQKDVIGWANDLFYRIGFTRIGTDLPVLGGLDDTKLFSLFLGLILNVIIFILLFLSILLIYSLLMINVETRVFEFGVMRMVGTSRNGVVMLLLVQAFFYSLPATILGLLCAEGSTFWVVSILKNILGVPLPPSLTLEGFGWATLLGLLVPIIASLLPIRSALGKNLQDSLDTRSSKTKAVKVTLSRADPREPLSPQVIIVGFCLSLFGAVIYYMFPLALLSMNLGLLLNTFFFLLIGMLLGLTMLSLNLQRLFETIVLYMFFFWENRAILTIISKNLIAHRVRNRKTTITYAISLGFIIFVSVAFSLQVSTFSYHQQQAKGSLLRVAANDANARVAQDGKPSSVNSNPGLLAALENVARTNADIRSHGWISLRLGSSLVNASETFVSHVGDLFAQMNNPYAVSPGFFDATLSGFLLVPEPKNSRGLEPSELSKYLYSKNGTGSLLVSRLYHEAIGVDVDSDLIIKITYMSEAGGQGDSPVVGSTYRKSYRMKTGALLDSAPGFTISPYPAIFRQESIMSFISYFYLLTTASTSTSASSSSNWVASDYSVYESMDDLPLDVFLVKLVDEKSVDRVVSALRDAIAPFGGVSVWDFRNEMGPFQTATTAMSYFFNFTVGIAMAISFFSLMASMFTNVYEQTKEIAVLRALGVKKFSMYRVYIYEAFVLVLSSSLLGIFIGSVVSYTMTLQQILFTELPIPFSFPWSILGTVFGCSVVFALLAAFSPIFRVLRKRVVQIFRIVT